MNLSKLKRQNVLAMKREAGSRSFKNLVVRANRFDNLEPTPLNSKMRGGIRAQLGSGLWVE